MKFTILLILIASWLSATGCAPYRTPDQIHSAENEPTFSGISHLEKRSIESKWTFEALDPKPPPCTGAPNDQEPKPMRCAQ